MPPGSDKEPGRGSHGRVPDDIPTGKRADANCILGDPPVNQSVADKLWRLHWDHGYFTRAEIEAALGLDSTRGRWECPGQFGDDGRLAPHCGGDAA